MLLESDWLYLDPTYGRKGPVPLESMRALLNDGVIGDSTLVSPKNGVWKEIREIPDLQRYLAGVSKYNDGNLEPDEFFAASPEPSEIKVVESSQNRHATSISQRIGMVLTWMQAVLFILSISSISIGISSSIVNGDGEPAFRGLATGSGLSFVGIVLAGCSYIASGEFLLLPKIYRNRTNYLLVVLPLMSFFIIFMFENSVFFQVWSLAIAVGGIFTIWLIAYLLAKFAIRTLEGPLMILVTTSLAFALTIVIAGFGFADGGNWTPPPSAYALSALLVFVIRYGGWVWKNPD